MAGIAIVCPPRALAQAQPTPDSGRVVLSTVLGGDSSQAASVTLRARATYRVQVQPARADLQIRRRVSGPTPPPFLVQTPFSSLDPTSWRTFDVTADGGGDHLVELTNPGIGASQIRVAMLHRAPSDTLPATARRHLLYTEDVSAGPAYIDLDSGVVYRVVALGSVYISPRSSAGAPVRLAPLIRGGGTGVAFIAPYAGVYKLEADPGTATSVQIWLEDADAPDVACVRDPRGPGCRATTGRTGLSRRGALVIILALPAILLLDAIFR